MKSSPVSTNKLYICRQCTYIDLTDRSYPDRFCNQNTVKVGVKHQSITSLTEADASDILFMNTIPNTFVLQIL